MAFEGPEEGGRPPEGETPPESGHPAPEGAVPATTLEETPGPPAATGGQGSSGPPAPPSPPDGGGDEEDGMLRMSFMEHLEELRMRILLSLAGIGVAFFGCLVFANDLWRIVSAPAVEALLSVGADPNLAQITPMDAFTTIWVKAPMLAALFLASPWVLYQVWAFIAPGLYRKERRWAGPFVLCTAGLFILGGLFAYFVAFRFGLAFLLSIGRDIHVKPVVSLVEYFDLFVNVTLGIGLVFELPVLIFFLTLLRVVSPRFLMRNVRYAILLIAILAAVVTPTPDVFNMMLFAVPMWLLFFLGVFASYLLVLRREGRAFPWKKLMPWFVAGVVVLALAAYWVMSRYGIKLVWHWPFLAR